MLRLPGSRLGPLDGDGVERLTYQALVRHIGAGHGNGQRHTTAIDERRTLHAQLASIGRVVAFFFPRPAATSSSPRPYSATASRSLRACRTRSTRVATTLRTHPTLPTLGSKHGWRCPSRTHEALPSTGSRCSARTRYPSSPCASASEVGHPRSSARRSESPSPCVPTTHREYRETAMLLSPPQAPPCRLRIVSTTCTTDADATSVR